MEDPSGSPLGLLFLLLALVFAVWFWIVLPAKMAIRRNRSAVIWVLISLLFSPVIAIFLLLVLGQG